MRRIEIRVPDDVADAIAFQAACRVKSVNEYCKDAVVSYMAKYPAKGPVASVVVNRDERPKDLGS